MFDTGLKSAVGKLAAIIAPLQAQATALPPVIAPVQQHAQDFAQAAQALAQKQYAQQGLQQQSELVKNLTSYYDQQAAARQALASQNTVPSVGAVASRGGGRVDPSYGNVPAGPGNLGNPTGMTARQAQALGAQMAAKLGWTGAQWQALNNVAMRESGWNPNSVNKSSGAYGIPQALGHGHVFNLGDAPAQIQWMLNYIKQRYGTPANAWAHEQQSGWY